MDKPNIHISIEGFDGVGKTTICRLLTEKLGYEFVEKPLHFLFDEEGSFDEYIRVRDKVNACPNRNLTSFFYGLGSLYLYHLYDGKNIVTDRHLCSNFAWSGTQDNKDVYDLLLKKSENRISPLCCMRIPRRLKLGCVAAIATILI